VTADRHVGAQRPGTRRLTTTSSIRRSISRASTKTHARPFVSSWPVARPRMPSRSTSRSAVWHPVALQSPTVPSHRNAEGRGTFFSHDREAHGLWTNPANDLLYIAHEQDELPGTPAAGQTVCTAFDVSAPVNPRFPHENGAFRSDRCSNDRAPKRIAARRVSQR
jgi:hypothetical protein